MPKRKSDKHDKYERISKKLKKLEREIKRGRRSRHDSASSLSNDSSSPHNQLEREPSLVDDDCARQNVNADAQTGCSFWNPMPTTEFDSEVDEISDPVVIQSPTADDNMTRMNTSPRLPNATNLPCSQQTLSAPSKELADVPTLLDGTGAVQTQDMSELDQDLLEILGEDPTSTNDYGKEIQKDLAIRLNHVATFGLSKENRKQLKETYLVPANCKFIKAPTLNPEIRASLVDTQIKRDKGIESKQALTTCALSSLSEAITLLLSSSQKNPELLKLLMDTARILGDRQYMDSMTRRSFVLSTVKKELRDQLEKTKIEDMLFGNDLSETLKSAKTIIKSAADIKSSVTMKTNAKKPVKSVTKTLNYQAPPATRRQYLPPPPGGARYPRGAVSTATQRQLTRTTQHNASKPSLRQPQARHRR